MVFGLKIYIYSLRKNDCFFAFCVYKSIFAKNRLLFVNGRNNYSHQQKTTCTSLYSEKAKKAKHSYIYITKVTLFKKEGNCCYVYIHKNSNTTNVTQFFTIFFFEIGTYICTKAWKFALRDIFIYKKPGTSKKARQFALRFLINKKLDTLHYTFVYGI